MTAPVIADEARLADTGNDADAIHIVCCDPNRALCGEDVSGEEWVDDGEPTTCITCEVIEELGIPSCGGPPPAQRWWS